MAKAYLRLTPSKLTDGELKEFRDKLMELKAGTFLGNQLVDKFTIKKRDIR